MIIKPFNELCYYWYTIISAIFYFSRGPQRRTSRTRRISRSISRSDAVFEGVERFSKRTISVCLSQAEEDADLPSVAEVEAILADDIEEDDEDTGSLDGDGDRDGEHTIS